MAFNSNLGRAEYTATLGQTIFPFVFKIFLDEDIKVYLTPSGQASDDTADILTLGVDYTIVIDGDNGGTVTLTAGASLSDSITLVRDLDINRLIEYQTSGDLTAITLNSDQNYQTYLIADKDTENTRFMRLSESIQGVSTELPAPEALKLMRWNSTEDGLENTTIGDNDVFINVFNVDNMAELLSINSTLYETVNVRGYHATNDGGGGIFNYDSTIDKSTANTGTIIDPGQTLANQGSGTGTGCWARQYSGSVNVKWFGAKGDGTTDDVLAIQSTLDFASDATRTGGLLHHYSYAQETTSLGLAVYIPAGTYVIKSQLQCESATHLYGDGNANTVLRADGTFIGTRILGIARSDKFWNWGVVVRDLKIIDNTGNTLQGIYAERLHDWFFENLEIANCSEGIQLNGCYSGTASELKVYKNTTGIATYNMTDAPIDAPSDGINFTNCVIHWNGIGYNLGGSRLININGGFIQENDNGGITTNSSTLSTGGILKLLKITGVYFEANGRTVGKQITGAIENLVMTENLISHYLTGHYFIDTNAMTNVTLQNNEIFEQSSGATEGNVVYIGASSTIEKLVYEHNRIEPNTNWQQPPINNNKTPFTPDPLFASDLEGIGGKVLQQNIKSALNGSMGVVYFDVNLVTKLKIDFPVKLIGIGYYTVVKDSTETVTGQQCALEILSSDVEIENIIFETDSGDICFYFGEAVSTYRNISLKHCKFISENNSCVFTQANSYDMSLVNCSVNRSGTAGSIIFLKGQGAFIRNIINTSPSATTSTIDTIGTYNKIMDNGVITWTNNGGATNTIL